MSEVNTVLGPINTDQLGFTLMHEHVMVSASGLYDSYPDLLGDDREASAIKSLKVAKAEGIDTIVDATTFDLGRNADLLVKVSRESGVNIINVTGWWLDVPRFLYGVSADQMAKEFIRDIEEGFRGTDIKAGILKCAADFEGVTENLETMARAVSRAHVRTGLPIMVCNRSGMESDDLDFRCAESIVARDGKRLLSAKSDRSVVLTFDWDLDTMTALSQDFTRTYL